jgi:hypothetical protein
MGIFFIIFLMLWINGILAAQSKRRRELELLRMKFEYPTAYAQFKAVDEQPEPLDIFALAITLLVPVLLALIVFVINALNLWQFIR